MKATVHRQDGAPDLPDITDSPDKVINASGETSDRPDLIADGPDQAAAGPKPTIDRAGADSDKTTNGAG